MQRGKNQFLPAKTIFIGAFSTEKNWFFHPAAKICQHWSKVTAGV